MGTLKQYKAHLERKAAVLIFWSSCQTFRQIPISYLWIAFTWIGFDYCIVQSFSFELTFMQVMMTPSLQCLLRSVIHKVRFLVSGGLRLDSVLQNVAWICLLCSVDAAKYSCCNSEYLSTLSPNPTSRYLRSCKLSSLVYSIWQSFLGHLKF